jgi:predicted ABC-type transport system involved in lysophospholipase L1 biosynthesis ATPase subunit
LPAVRRAHEPTGALDTQTGKDILALFASLNAEGAAVVIVTHDMEVAQRTRRTVEMRDGRIVGDRRHEQTAA